MALFDLPPARGNKASDKDVLKRSKSAKITPVVVRGDSLLDKITAINASVEKHLGEYKDRYEVATAETLSEYIKHCIENGICAIDTETTGLDPINDDIVGLSIYTPGHKAIYVPIHHVGYISGNLVSGQVPVEVVKEQLALLDDCKIIMFNAKFDMRVIHNHVGVELKCYFDCYLAAKCLNENEDSFKLKQLHRKYVMNGEKDAWDFVSLFQDINFAMVSIETAYVYAARDAEITYELYQFQLPYLTTDDQKCIEQDLVGVCNVFWNIEMPCIKVLADMEDNGIAFDLEYAEELSEKYHKILDKNLDDFYRILGMYEDDILAYKLKNPNHKLSDPISVSSPTQLAILFYDILKIEPPDPKTPRGTGVEILAKIDNPLSKAILDYRATEKLLSTYIDKLPECVGKDGRIHCAFNQYGAKTGRMSSDNPNLQNIPSHNKDIRKLFVASPGYVLMSGDFSQQEPKVMTAMCRDPKMIQAYKEGKDLYAEIAALSFNTTYENCLEFRPDGTTNPEGKNRRSQAKSILLGVLYGRGVPSIAEQLGTTTKKAQAIKDSVMKGFPAIEEFEQDSLRMAEELGYVTTFWGRKRRLPEMQLPEFEFRWKPGHGDVDPLSFENEVVETEVPEDVRKKYIRKLRQNPYKKRGVYEEAANEGIIITDNGGKIADATRQCVNSRIQGSAADMTKIAGRIINENERLRELGFRLLVPVHDEFIGEAPIENAKECKELFSKCMCEAAKDLGLPISVDIEVTDRWYGEAMEI